jgi:hypothetical protein
MEWMELHCVLDRTRFFDQMVRTFPQYRLAFSSSPGPSVNVVVKAFASWVR